VSNLYIVDFACVLPYGHCPYAVKYFSDYFQSQNNFNFENVTQIVCRDLPTEIDFIPLQARQLPFLYSRNMIKDFIPSSTNVFNFFDTASSLPLRKLRKWLFDRSKKRNFDIFEYIAEKHYEMLFRKYQISSCDRFFFHSASYYCIVGLLRYLSKIPPDDWPKIHFRLIGVLESSTLGDGYQRLIKRFRNHFQLEKKHGKTILYLSAEVPIYAHKLSIDLMKNVSVTYYPLIPNGLQKRKNDIFTIVFPGAGRADKGFFSILQILQIFYHKYPDKQLKVIAQPINITEAMADANQVAYLSQLNAVPNFTLLPHKISEQQMLENYAQADAVVLPYDRETYALRGSAILQESISYGLSLITYDNTGFAEIMKYYDCSCDLCNNETDIADTIYLLMNESDEQLAFRDQHAKRVRSKYLRDFEHAYNNLWN
jgi:glycosyltransferase involved in cell wall biosynthesis